MAFATDPSERDKIDDVLRLPGLKFPKGQLVIGKKNLDLMLALGAIDTKRHRAGKQLLVVQRLCILYHAVLRVARDCPFRGINHERLYEVALLSISDKHREMTKYLTPESLRHVIDLYRKAFARSGWKVIKKADEDIIQEQMNLLFERRAVKDIGGVRQWTSGGETMVETTEDTTTEVLEPIEPIGDRVKLEKLVKMWMVVRGRKRAKTAPDTPELENPFFPQQDPDESAPAYMLRVKNAFRELIEDNDDLKEINGKRAGTCYALYDQCDDMQEVIDEQKHQIDEQKQRIDELEQRLRAAGEN